MTSPRALVITLLALWLAVALAYQIGAQFALRRFLTRTREAKPAKGPLPSSTILRPLFGQSLTIERNIDFLCSLGVSVVAGVDRESDPAAELVRRVAARHPPGRLTLRTGAGPAGANRKVASLIRMLPDAAGDVVVFTDDDVGVPPGYVGAVLSPFEDPRVGLVTGLYRSVGGASLPERIDVILTNTQFLPSVLFAAGWEGVRFALGSTVAVRGKVLRETGGLEPILDRLADDHALAEQVLKAGHRIVIAPILLDHHVEDENWRAVWGRHLRWARTARALRPGGYVGTIVTHGAAPAIAMVLAARPATGCAVLAAWGLIRIGGAAVHARALGLSARDLALLPLADLVAVALYVGSLAGRSVEWGGGRFRIRRDGSMAPLGTRRVVAGGREGVVDHRI